MNESIGCRCLADFPASGIFMPKSPFFDFSQWQIARGLSREGVSQAGRQFTPPAAPAHPFPNAWRGRKMPACPAGIDRDVQAFAVEFADQHEASVALVWATRIGHDVGLPSPVAQSRGLHWRGAAGSQPLIAAILRVQPLRGVFWFRVSRGLPIDRAVAAAVACVGPSVYFGANARQMQERVMS